MRRPCSLLLTCLLAAAPAAGAMPATESSFAHLSTEDGLSQETVISIVQDSRGLIWIASFDGLNRYDGYDVKVYKTQDGLPGNTVFRLFSASDGSLWIGTHQGLARMDPAQDSIQAVNKDNYHLIYDFVEPAPGTLWIATSKGLLSATLGEDEPKISGVSAPSLITAFARAGTELYAGDESGKLYLCNPQTRTLEPLDFNLGGKRIARILCEDKNLLWIATDGNGLFCLNLQNGHLTQFRHGEGRDDGLCSNFVQDLCLDDANNLWIGTGNKLCIRSKADGRFVTIEHDPMRPESLAQNSVRALLADRSGGIWLGTFYGGVSYYHPQRDFFRTVTPAYTGGEMIGCIAEGPDHTLWLGTNRNGILQLNLQTGRVRNINLTPPEQRREGEMNDVKAIVFSADGRRAYCATTLGGLNRIDLPGGHLTHISQNSLPGIAYTILPESDGLFWVGGEDGLCLFDERSGALRRVELQRLGDALITSLHRDSAGHLWIGTEHKLLRCTVNPAAAPESRLQQEEVYGYTWVNCIHESRSGELWFASSQGLIRHSPRNNEWECYEMPVGANLKGIEEDAAGRLWITSDRELYLFRPQDETVRVFSGKDGITKGPFGTYAHFKDRDGLLYFGGRHGLSRFSPEAVERNGDSPAPLLTELRENANPRGRNLIGSAREDLWPSCNSFSIRFACPDYLSWQQSRFQYRLDGMDRDWIDADESRTARYGYLPAGRYLFRLRSMNCDGVPSEESATLELVIHPVWYRSLPARIVWYTLLLLGVFWLLYWAWKRIQARTKKEINQLKMRALLNIKEERLDAKGVSFLSEAFRIVQEHLSDEAFSMDDFAKALHMSRTSLHLHMKALTGDSALSFVKRIRFEEARRLLRESDLTVAEVGYRVGYSTPSYFVSSFKKQFGITPKEFASGCRK